MANNSYIIDQLATGTETVNIIDDGTGIDWLVFEGIYAEPTEIRLNWTPSAGTANSAMGFYFTPGEISGNVGHRLVITGLIENAKGSNGLDFIVGNEQNNTLYGDNARGGIGGSDTLSGDAGNDRIYGGSGNDSIGGASGNDLLFGDAGVDTISGGDGNDVIVGGAGADIMSGGANVRDTVSYVGSNAAVNVKITFGTTTTGSGGHAQGDKITGFADVIGSIHSDIISDTNAGTIAFGFNDNRFYGGSGNDTLGGGGGADRLDGGIGNDVINAGIGNDSVYGGVGNDVIRGDVGRDVLLGGLGADRFLYRSAAETSTVATARDTIYDFKRIEGDRIDFRPIDPDPQPLNQAMFWLGSAAFDGHLGAVRAINSGANTLVQVDLNGDKAADMSILLLGINDMVKGDFFL